MIHAARHPKIVAMDRNVQLLVAYDGTDFHGWQTQLNQRAAQSEIESIAQRVVRHPVNLIASGRTDAGVHAAGQVCNFHTSCDLPPGKLCHAIGSRLPEDISLLRVRDVPAGFHAMRSAVSKLYRYRIHHHNRRPVGRQQQRYAYHYYRPLNVELMRQAARHFVGTYDFKAMASTRSTPRLSNIRTILCCDVYTAYEEIRIDVRGTGFLHNQVRNMVGTLVEIGKERWPPDAVAEILESRDRQNAGATAPAHGLCLQWVEYVPDHLIPPVAEHRESAERKQTVETAP